MICNFPKGFAMKYFIKFLSIGLLSFAVSAAPICYKRNTEKFCAQDLDKAGLRTILIDEVKHDHACNPSDDCFLQEDDRFVIQEGGAAIWYKVKIDLSGKPELDKDGKKVYVKKALTFSLISKEYVDGNSKKVIRFLKDTSEGYDIFILFRGTKKCSEIRPARYAGNDKQCKIHRFEIFSQGFKGEKPDTATWEPMLVPIEPDTGGGHEPP